MYELLVLSLLMKFPLHAYLISKIANDTIGPWETVSRGTLSTLLNKLNKAGFIQEANPENVPFPSERSSRTYEITDKGKDRFYELMMETEKGLGNYQKIFRTKAAYLDFLCYEDQVYLVDHYTRYCQKAIDHIKEQQLEFDENPNQIQPMQNTYFFQTIQGLMDHQMNQWKLELEWISRLKEQIKTNHSN